MQRIVIAGFGPVGQAVENVLKNHRGIDLYMDDPAKGLNFPEEMTDTVDGVIVCVATPMNDAGFCERKNVEAVFEKYGYVKYLIKSAVTPDILETNDHLDITVSPEFLVASSNPNRSSTKEFLEQTFAIYGGGSMRYWHELFKPVLPHLKDVKFCSRDQAAFAKYVENTFLAMKVTFWNQMYEIYTAMGYEDFDVMVDAIGVDPRIGTGHSQVPGPDGKFGFGGHCLPKDVNALMNMGSFNGANVEFLESLLEVNERYRGKEN